MADHRELPVPTRADLERYMTTKETRIDRVNRLLKQQLTPKDRLRVATMKLGDQKRLALRKKYPELDRHEKMQLTTADSSRRAAPTLLPAQRS